jgi:hypothetical protein
VLLFSFQTNQLVQAFALALIGVPAIAFIVMFAWKSERDPDFCRSETHVQKIRKYELEVMGSESKPIEADVLDAASHLPSAVTPRALPNEKKGGHA